MNKLELLECLLLKKIIPNIEDFENLSDKQLELLLISGCALLTEVVDDREIMIQNKRLKQEMGTFKAALKAKIIDLAKIIDPKK